MQKYPAIITLLFLICLLNAQINNGMADMNSKKFKKHYKQGELLVKYRAYVGTASAKLGNKAFDIATIRSFKKIRVQHVKLPKNMSVEQALDVYQMNPDVEYAEPNYRFHATATPNDTYFNRLWGLHNTGQDVYNTSGTSDADIDAIEAWNITTGSSQVIVAVVDSGVDYNHPDLASNIWTNPGEVPDNGIDDDENGYIDDVNGWDFVDPDDNDPMDLNNHGTHVAGTIAAIGNNDTGVSGVAWSTQIMVLRGLDTDGYGWTSDLMNAIVYASSNGAHVINNSWGGEESSQPLKDAIAASPAVVVCAAGNDGLDNDITPHYPSNYNCDNIIAVAATNQFDTLASFSNYGAVSVDVAAPGTNIYSTVPIRQTIWSDDFDDGPLDWTTGGTNNTWGLTSSDYLSPGYSLADSPSGDYQNYTNSWARSPSFNLSSHKGARLDFNGKASTEEDEDFLYLETSSDGTNWTANPYPFSGSTYGTWFPITADLTALDESSTGYVRFRFDTNHSNVDDGCFIDDMTLTVSSTAYDNTSEYGYKSGTSMAAPMVSGIAALLKAYKPALTNSDIKAIIENTVDPKASLTDTVTGGRVNAFNALDSLKIDIDDDNDVDIEDAILALQVLAGTNPSSIRSDYVSSLIDVNGDNQIGMEEVIFILQVVAGIR